MPENPLSLQKNLSTLAILSTIQKTSATGAPLHLQMSRKSPAMLCHFGDQSRAMTPEH
jgi:hypothetical protein